MPVTMYDCSLDEERECTQADWLHLFALVECSSLERQIMKYAFEPYKDWETVREVLRDARDKLRQKHNEYPYGPKN